MGVFTKLITALRGGLNEAGEALIDSQAMRILEQEIREAKDHLDEAKQNLAKIMAEQIGIEREIKRLQARIHEYEGYTIQALERNDSELANEIASKIAVLEDELAAQQLIYDGYQSNVQELRTAVRQTEHNISAINREINIVKATESVHKANRQTNSQFRQQDSALHSAKASLEKIRRRQQQRNDEMKAAMIIQQQNSDEELHVKLRNAGILKQESSAAQVLQRIQTLRKK